MDRLEARMKELRTIIDNHTAYYKNRHMFGEIKRDRTIVEAKRQLRYLKYGSADRDASNLIEWSSFPENIDIFMRKYER